MVNATPSRTWPVRLPWPLPALGAWLLAAAVHQLAQPLGPWGWVAACAAGLAVALGVRGRWRRLIVAAGYPLASVVAGADVPAWAWLMAAALLLMAYPLRAWRDAPQLQPPSTALLPLAEALPLEPGDAVLDAGCGLGHGLKALRKTWPQARLEGVEWSRPLSLLCRWHCRFARVHRGDMWSLDWSPYVVVYLFQRPESMERAWRKALAEMRGGGWLASLEFEVPGLKPLRRLDAGGGRALWLYRVPQRDGSHSKSQPTRR